MMVELGTGALPWKRIKDKKQIAEMKRTCNVADLVVGLPEGFEAIHKIICAAGYADEPDYGAVSAKMRSFSATAPEAVVEKLGWLQADQTLSAAGIRPTAQGGLDCERADGARDSVPDEQVGAGGDLAALKMQPAQQFHPPTTSIPMATSPTSQPVPVMTVAEQGASPKIQETGAVLASARVVVAPPQRRRRTRSQTSPISGSAAQQTALQHLAGAAAAWRGDTTMITGSEIPVAPSVIAAPKNQGGCSGLTVSSDSSGHPPHGLSLTSSINNEKGDSPARLGAQNALRGLGDDRGASSAITQSQDASLSATSERARSDSTLSSENSPVRFASHGESSSDGIQRAAWTRWRGSGQEGPGGRVLYGDLQPEMTSKVALVPAREPIPPPSAPGHRQRGGAHPRKRMVRPYAPR